MKKNKCKHQYEQLSSCSNPICIYCGKQKKWKPTSFQKELLSKQFPQKGIAVFRKGDSPFIAA